MAEFTIWADPEAAETAAVLTGVRPSSTTSVCVANRRRPESSWKHRVWSARGRSNRRSGDEAGAKYEDIMWLADDGTKTVI